jgi:hypothetical protein
MTDCYHKALHDEPRFTLLARDPEFNRLVFQWANKRASDIRCGLRPESDWESVYSAREIAVAGEKWRKENNGKWRT